MWRQLAHLYETLGTITVNHFDSCSSDLPRVVVVVIIIISAFEASV